MKRDSAFVVLCGAVAAVLFVPPGMWIGLGVVLSCVLACAVIGLYVARRVRLPILPDAAGIGRTIAAALGAGIAIGAAALIPLAMIIGRSGAVRSRVTEEVASAVWRRVLISLDSAIIEEIGFRLFVLSCAAWIVSRIASRAPALLTANIVSAAAFAASHVPRWLALHASPEVVVIVIVVNLAAGLVLGTIYIRWGLLIAMTTHFAADLTVHVAGPHLLIALTR